MGPEAGKRLERIAAEKCADIFQSTHARDEFAGKFEPLIASTYRERERLVEELLKALEPIKECPHDEETWYCDSCKYDWEKRVRAAAAALRVPKEK